MINPAFTDLLGRLSGTTTLEVAPPPVNEEPELLEDEPELTLVRPAGPTLEDLIMKAEQNGFSEADLITAARHYCNGKTDLQRLSPEEISDLDRRLSTRIEKERAREEAQVAAVQAVPEPVQAARGGRARRG
jgi:hypothetical protein